DLKAPGVTCRPIKNIAGDLDFNEIRFDDVFVPAGMLIGTEGGGWQQVTSELAFERSGPERWLSTFTVLVELVRRLGATPDARAAEAAGRLVAHIWTLRRMSISVAGMLQAGEQPNLEAAIVKDLGTALEREIPEIARLVGRGRRGPANDRFE